MTENEVTSACDTLMVAHRWDVERYDKRKRSGVMPGLPDRRYCQDARGLRVWIEMKQPGKQMGYMQHLWIRRELNSGGYATVIDDVFQLKKLLDLFAMPRIGRHEAVHAYCTQLVELVAARGYRDKNPDAATT